MKEIGKKLHNISPPLNFIHCVLMFTEIKVFTVMMNIAYKRKLHLIQDLTRTMLRIPKRHRENHKLIEIVFQWE